MAPENLLSLERRRYRRAVLELYQRHPNTTGRIRKPDRDLVDELFQQRIGIDTIHAALLLVAARCAHRTEITIRSLHYFLPAIREVIHQPLDPDYLRLLELRLRSTAAHDHRSV